jgi:hypothetical protein
MICKESIHVRHYVAGIHIYGILLHMRARHSQLSFSQRLEQTFEIFRHRHIFQQNFLWPVLASFDQNAILRGPTSLPQRTNHTGLLLGAQFRMPLQPDHDGQQPMHHL